MDSFSKSDPQVVVFMKENGAWGEVGRSEVIDDNLNRTKSCGEMSASGCLA